MSIAEKLVTISDNMQNLFNAGKQAEYDTFWKVLQLHGNKNEYYFAFAGSSWNSWTLNPKYIIAPVDETVNSLSVQGLFYHCNRGNEATGLGKIDYRNIAHMFDFANIKNAQGMFANACMDYIVVDFSNVEAMQATFQDSNGYQTHITLTVSEKCTNFANAFYGASNLTDLIFTEGSVIAANLDVKSCPLSKESITSIINALSSSVTGKTLALKKTAKEAAFTSAEWSALIATKTNWTISLA